ncbi:MAG: phospholipase [Myxococcaceae bacterium]|nr:phospholipase [Myxococcaceae bacterium]
MSSSLSLHTAHAFSSSAGKLHYLSYEPPGWADTARPFVLFLHGAGQRGSDLEQVAQHGIPREIEHGKNMPFVAVSPQCPSGTSWSQLTSALQELLDELVPRFRLDDRRLYLTGMSMGAFGAWKLAAERPQRFAALIPVCGGGDPSWAKSLQTLPTWAFHGEQDDVVPVAKTQVMVEALQSLGAPVRLTLYPGVGHDSWTQAYETPELYDWMLGQRRGSLDGGRAQASNSPHAAAWNGRPA